MDEVASRDAQLGGDADADADADETVPRARAVQEQVDRFASEVDALDAPYPAVLAGRDAAAGARIDGFSATALEIADAGIGERDTGDGPNVIARIRALDAALALDDPFTVDALVSVHTEIVAGTAPRDGSGSSLRHDRVAAELLDLFAAIRRSSASPLATAATAYARLATIEPFASENEAVARVLAQTVLFRADPAASTIVPLAVGLEARAAASASALTAYRAGDSEPIIDVFLDAAEHSVDACRDLILESEALRASWTERMHGLRSDAASRRIASLALIHPSLTSKLIKTSVTTTVPTIFTGLEALVERGILEEKTARRRNRVWIAPEILAIFDRFDARAVSAAPPA